MISIDIKPGRLAIIGGTKDARLVVSDAIIRKAYAEGFDFLHTVSHACPAASIEGWAARASQSPCPVAIISDYHKVQNWRESTSALKRLAMDCEISIVIMVGPVDLERMYEDADLVAVVAKLRGGAIMEIVKDRRGSKDERATAEVIR